MRIIIALENRLDTTTIANGCSRPSKSESLPLCDWAFSVSVGSDQFYNGGGGGDLRRAAGGSVFGVGGNGQSIGGRNLFCRKSGEECESRSRARSGEDTLHV